MEFLNFKGINSKLKKRGILFKKPNVEDATAQFHSLARQLDDHKLYAGYCHLAISNCQPKSARLGALLNAARAFSEAREDVISLEDHIRAVIWIYTEALMICDRSFIRPVCLEIGRFYESHNMHQQAADCFKQAMSISRCVDNLILARKYSSALDELKSYPSHLMTVRDHTNMFLLELLLNEDLEELNRNSLQYLSASSGVNTDKGPLPIDDHLFDLFGLLKSLLIFRQERKDSSRAMSSKEKRILDSITNKLCAFLDPTQIKLLYLITTTPT